MGGSLPFLRAVTGPLAGTSVPVAGELVIGRDEKADITLPDAAVSREHATVVRSQDGAIMITDHSKNGTFVAGQPVRAEQLNEGDMIRIGRSQFVLELASDDDSGRQFVAPSSAEMDPFNTQTVSDLSALARKAFQHGRYRQPTQPISEDDIPADCDDALHADAKRRGWTSCPVCNDPL